MPRTHRPYPPEFRAEAVRLARGSDKSIPALAADLGVSSEALRHWLRQDDADAGRGQPGELTTDEREELRRLRREDHVLKQEREILKKATCLGYFAHPRQFKPVRVMRHDDSRGEDHPAPGWRQCAPSPRASDPPSPIPPGWPDRSPGVAGRG